MRSCIIIKVLDQTLHALVPTSPRLVLRPRSFPLSHAIAHTDAIIFFTHDDFLLQQLFYSFLVFPLFSRIVLLTTVMSLGLKRKALP